MTKCELCDGKGFITRPHAHPQNTIKKDVCPVCNGTGEAEIIQVDGKRIVIYKAYGIFTECGISPNGENQHDSEKAHGVYVSR